MTAKIKMVKKSQTMVWLGLIAMFVLSACSESKNSPAAASQAQVIKQLSPADVVITKTSAFAQTIPITGSLAPLKEATVSAEAGGTVAKLLVDEGNLVQAGQVIAVMDNQAARENLQSQQAQVQSSQANLALAQTKLKQQQVLFNKGFVSRLALEQAQNEYQVAVGSHKTQQAELAKAQKNQADAQVRAPISGVVYDKLANAGELLNAGGQILKIAQISILEMAATVSSEQVSFIHTGQEVTFTVAAGAPQFTGRITRINPVADANTRQFTVFVQVNNADSALKAGQFAQGQIVLNRIPSTIVIPAAALHKEQDQTFVLLIEKGKLTKRNVTVQLQDALTDQVAITGVQAGDVVLRAQLLGVKAGDAVSLEQVGK